MDVFIAGCAKSGTGLMRDLMHTFGDTFVADREATIARFDGAPDGYRNRVVKRTAKCWQTLPDLPEELSLIYMIRHPYDVLTSLASNKSRNKPYYVSLERWENEYNSLRSLIDKQPDRKIIYVKYEDLITDSDSVQSTISELTQMNICTKFSSYGIFKSSLYKWKKDLDRIEYLKNLPRNEALLEFCTNFNYSMGLCEKD